MCVLQEKSIISCQIAYYPIGTVQYNAEISKVIDIIETSGVFYEIGEMSTVLKGEHDIIFSVLQQIVKRMNGNKFVLNFSVSNVCGCE